MELRFTFYVEGLPHTVVKQDNCKVSQIESQIHACIMTPSLELGGKGGLANIAHPHTIAGFCLKPSL